MWARRPLVVLACALVLAASTMHSTAEDSHVTHSSSWVVHIPDARDREDVSRIASEVGGVVIPAGGHGGAVIGRFYHVYLNTTNATAEAKTLANFEQQLKSHNRIEDVIFQYPRMRSRRNFASEMAQLSLRTRALDDMTDFSDPLYPEQRRYLDKLGVTATNGPWAQGFDGTGVVITTVDDGIITDHTDLAANYDPEASHNFNPRAQDDPYFEDDSNPYPNLMNPNNSHGTRVAGVAAAVANNSVCGVGIAYGARIGGIRMLDNPGGIPDAIESASLSWMRNHVDIYINSWGPPDDGSSFEGPHYLTRKALREGTTLGRNGLGSLFIWAGGNGGHNGDECGADGYVSNVNTIAINAVSAQGTLPAYGEQCTSILASTVSERLSTTDMPDGCVDDAFSGTSAAAPVAAASLALVLQAAPCLTSRDIQHLLVQTSEPTHLSVTNAANHSFSRASGFGHIRADRLVDAAKQWVSPIPSQMRISLNMAGTSNFVGERVIGESVSGCHQQDQSICIERLEHVVVRMDIDVTLRGDIKASIISPSGSESILLSQRPRDTYTGPFQWDFLTVQLWDEAPSGTWQLRVKSASGVRINSWSLTLYGTGTYNLQQTQLFLPTKELPNACKICNPRDEFTSSDGMCGRCDSSCGNGCFAPGPNGCMVIDDGEPDSVIYVVDKEWMLRRMMILFALLGIVVLIHALIDQYKKRRDMNRLVAIHNDLNGEPLLHNEVHPPIPVETRQTSSNRLLSPDGNNTNRTEMFTNTGSSVSSSSHSTGDFDGNDYLELYAVEDADSKMNAIFDENGQRLVMDAGPDSPNATTSDVDAVALFFPQGPAPGISSSEI